MPYSGPNDPSLPSNVKSMTDDDRAKWVNVFNSAYESCISDGGSSSDCEATAFKQANGVLKKQAFDIFRSLSDAFKSIFKVPKTRSLCLADLYNQVGIAAWEDQSSEGAWLLDVYLGNDGIFAILSAKGKLYKAPVSVDIDSNTASIPTFQDWIEVKEEYTPIIQNRFKIRAQQDGSYRWFLIAGTTILNRNAQIDSSQLFDNMIRKCEQSGDYPYLTFYHLAENFKMGESDFLARDGVALIASGLFLSNKVAQAMIKAYNADPEFWGSSIGFYAQDPDMLEIAQDVKLPVYTDGELIEISILPETEACAIMTALRSTKEVNRMNKRVEEAIKKLAGDDEELAQEFVGLVDDVNRATEEQGLIHRASEEEEVPAEEAPVVEEEPVADESSEQEELAEEKVVPVLEVDDAVIQQIADKVIPSITTMLDEMRSAIESLSRDVLALHGAHIQSVKDLNKELDVLKRSEEEKRLEWENDVSSKVINKVRVTHRPTQRSDEAEQVQNFAEIASTTISNIK